MTPNAHPTTLAASALAIDLRAARRARIPVSGVTGRILRAAPCRRRVRV